MRKHLLVSVTFLFTSLLVLAVSAVAADPFAGKWKLNLARSKYHAGQAPKKYEVHIKNLDNGLQCKAHRVEVDGKEYREEWSAKYDGKDYPMTGDPTVDTVALKRIDAGTIEVVFKKGGKEVETSRVVVSPDGKTTTVMAKAKDDKGQDPTAVLILEKQ